MRTLARQPLLRGSALTTVAVGLNGLGGFAFWMALAVTQDAADVGEAQRLFTAVMVVTYLTSLGLPVAVAKFCPDRSPDAMRFFRWAVAATVTSSVLGAGVLVVVAGRSSILRPLAGDTPLVQFVVLSAAAAGLSCAVLVESRLMALRRWGWVVVRVCVAVLLRFPFLLLVPTMSSTWSFALAAGLPAATGIVGVLVLDTIAVGGLSDGRVDPALRRRSIRYSAMNYVGLLGAQGPQFLVPLAVALVVPSAQFVPFYLCWGATVIVFAVPHVIGQAVLSESSHVGTVLAALSRSGMALSLGITGLLGLGALGAGPLLAMFLGSGYGTVAFLLPILVLAAIPWAVTSTALAAARANGESRRLLVLTSTYLLCTVGGVSLGVLAGGIVGAAVGWLGGNAIAGGWALVGARTAVAVEEPTQRFAVDGLAAVNP